MTTVYLAWGSSGVETLSRHADGAPVDLLVAFPELKAFERNRKRFNVRSWCMDSGAFAAWNSGVQINLDEYIAACKDVDAAEVFGLDAIGDWQATRLNLETMWTAGVDAIPTYHEGEPWACLQWAASRPKMALGGVARRGLAAINWAAQCFARVWPQRVHGFAMSSWQVLRALPFDSVDASSWCYAPAAMGCWAGYTGSQIRLKSRGVRDYWLEVVEHQRRASWSAARWKNELARARNGQ